MSSCFQQVFCHQWTAKYLRHVAALVVTACAAFALGTQQAHGLDASFNTATDVPVISAGYNASGEISFTLGFVPTAGTSLTVVKNTGLGFINGQFSNLANGALVNLTHNGTTYPFVAWYYGGEGNNDLVLLWPYTGLAAWGRNSYGQLGDNSTTNRTAPVDIDRTDLLLGKAIVQVARGQDHSLALCSDGTVAAWGRNDYGQLGDNSTTNRLVPVAVNVAAGTSALAGKTVISIAAGAHHSLALCSDGTVAAWGRNDYGQLGENSQTQRSVPVAVNMASGTSALFGKTVVAIAAGSNHSLALSSDGKVAAWGSNSAGQLGNNSPFDSPAPAVVDVASGTSALFGKTVVAIAAGSAHSLALSSDGTVAAWGTNFDGQLGNNTSLESRRPVAVSMASGASALYGKTVIAVAAGNLHSLALCSDGTVAAWGSNSNGQLGDNSGTGRLVPVAVSVTNGTSALFGKTVTAVAAGSAHSLALCSDGTVAAWGVNGNGQLGDTGTTLRLAPVLVNVTVGTSVLSGRRASLLSPGTVASHTIAIYARQAPPTVTLNTANLAISSTTLTILGSGFDTTTPGNNTVAFTPAGSGTVTGSSATSLTVTSLSDLTLGPLNAVVTTNGLNSGAAVQVATVVPPPPPPTVTLNTGNLSSDSTMLIITGTNFNADIPGNNKVVFTPTGTGTVTAATTTSLTVTGLTGLSLGPLGAVVTTNGQSSSSAVQVATVISPGLTATFNSARDVPVTTASYTASGPATFTLGFAPPVGTNLTVVKNTGLGFISGQFSNLANGATVNLSYNGTTYPFIAWYYGGEGNNDLVLLWPYTGLAAWGNNSYGQLGDGTTTHHAAPVAVWQRSALLGKTVVQVARGDNHSLALCSDGAILYWGKEGNRSFGGPSWPKVLEVGTSVLSGKTVIAISASAGQNLALCSDGTVAAWGTADSAVPVAISNAEGTSALFGKTVVAISSGTSHSLALCSDGTVAAWGENIAGQLGNNSQASSPVPVAVNVASGTSALFGKTVTAIAAGGYHNLALCSDGTVASWGSNVSGELGDNSLTARAVPVAVNMASGMSELFGKTVVSVTAGASHSLALCSDGTVAAWGDNLYGQLGDNTVTDRLIPVAVNMASGTSALSGRIVTAIAAGGSHNLALCSDGSLAAWGYNVRGQLGDASTTQRNVPVAVNVLDGQSVLFGRPVSGMPVSFGALHNVVVYAEAAASEIVVRGGGYDIPNGSTTPRFDRLTEFGEVQIVNSRRTNRFTISSVGNIPLHLTGTPVVTLSGPDADAFEVLKVPSSTLPVGGSSSFDISFDPAMPGQHSATVTIQSDAVDHSNYSFVVTGMGALSTKRSQTITFAPPSTVFTGQSPLNLSAYSSSGLPVLLLVQGVGTTAPGAAIVGNTLSFTGTGVVKIQAVQIGDSFYSAAPTVVKTITVKANPTVLTLLNLAQTYTGTPREISTLGGSGTVTIEYKIGSSFGNTAPTNAGSYALRATDSKGTKTGTLVIAKAPLFVTPDDQTKFVGQDNPPLTLAYSGWVNGDSASLVTAAPILKTTATKTSTGGVYPITASGGAPLANYAFIYQQGALVVDSFAADYEALLTDGSDELIGKLNITVVAANSGFTGKLYCIDEKAALSLKGTFLTNPATKSATGSATVTSGGIPYVVNITAQIDGIFSVLVTRGDSPYAESTKGRRLLVLPAGQTALYAGAHTAVLEPATPAANNVPKGAGWATAAISTKGVMTFAGRLGDGTSFTTALTPDDAVDPVFRLFVQPYKTGSAIRLLSYFGGAFTLIPHPSTSPTLVGRRYVEAAALTWAKAGLAADTGYSAGFDPVSTVLVLDPWLPPTAAKGTIPAIPLATRLGLTNSSFAVLHSDTGSTLNGNLPTRVSLSSSNAVTVTTPVANTTKWKTKLAPATGLFSGSFELADTDTKPRVVNFTGILRQPVTAEDNLIGDGHYLLPPLEGTEKRTGEVLFVRP